MKEKAIGEKSCIFLRCRTGWLRRVVRERLWFDRLRGDYDRQKQEPAETACISRQVAGFHDFPPLFFARRPHAQWLGQRLRPKLAGKPGKSLNEILEFCW